MTNSPQSCSAGSARALVWQETFTDRGDGSQDHSGWEAESGFNTWYMIEMYFGSDSYGWTVEHDLEKIGEADDPEIAKQIAQRDFNRRVVEALIPGVAQSVVVPDGWKLVPLIPTERMIEVGCDNNPTQWNEGTDHGFPADVASDIYVSMVRAAQPPAAPVETARVPKVRTSHHRNKEEAARLQALVNERHNSSSAGNVDAIATLMIRDMFADHELPVDEAVFHKYEDLARKILIHLRVEPQEAPEPTARDVIAWLEKRQGISWKSTIDDINCALSSIALSLSRPHGGGK